VPIAIDVDFGPGDDMYLRQLLDALRGLERIAPAAAVPNESVLRNIIRVVADSQMSLVRVCWFILVLH